MVGSCSEHSFNFDHIRRSLSINRHVPMRRFVSSPLHAAFHVAIAFILAAALGPAGAAQAQQPVPSEELPDGMEWAPDSERIVRPAEPGEFQGARRPAPFDLNTFESVQRLGATDWPRDDINFRPTGPARPAGDVNGDGVRDWIYRYGGVPDDRATGPERTAKTFLRFGGETFSASYYDQLVYRSLIPAGDLVGSANADAIVRDSASIAVFEGGSGGYSETGTRSLSINGSLAGTGDLDGDGFEDLVYTNRFTPEITILFGGQALSDLEAQSYEPAFEKDGRFSYAVGDPDEDGTGSLLRIHGDSRDFGPDDSLSIDLFGVDNARNLVVDQEFSTDLVARSDVLTPELANIDGAALKEIFVRGAQEGSGRFVFQVASDSSSYDNVPVEYPNADRLVGDLNGDGRADFYLDADSGPSIGFGPAAVESGVSPDVSVPEATGESLGFASTGPLGDLTGDGSGNVIFDLQGPSQFGYRRVGVSGGNAETADLTFDNAAYRTSATVAGTNAGDWDGDGTDDAALVRETYNFAEDRTEGTVNVYFGDPTQQVSPDLTLTNPNGAQATNVAAGDFTGNGQPNLLVVWRDSVPNVSVYEAGSGASPIHTLNTSDIGPIAEGQFSYSTATTAGNVGDVNGDGVEDFLIGAPATQVGGSPVQEAFLFLGGASLPNSPSVTIDYSGLDTDPGSLVSGIQGLGDINQDGIEDFAVGDLFGNQFFGQVFVHFGQQGDPGDLSFDQPDVVIAPDPGTNAQIFPLGMASGDFNGDGTPDLAAKPFQFPGADGAGGDAVRVYFGGSGFDATPDATFPVPGDPVDPDGSDTGPSGNLTSSLGELTTVPRFGTTTRDALLFGTSFGTTNALIFEAAADSTFEATTVLSAFDNGAGLGANNNLVANNNRTSAIGVFGQNDRLTPVLPQENSAFFRGRPGFTYDLPTPALDQRFGPEQVIAPSSAGEEQYIRDIADLDGDGDKDLVAVSANDDSLEFRWYANDGSGSFTEQPPIQTVTEGSDELASIEAVDLNQDGDQDLIWASYRQDKIAWQPGQGDGTFGPPQTISNTAVDPAPFSISVGDIDGDNDIDIVALQDLTANPDTYKGLVWYPNQIGETGGDSDGFGQRQIITSDFTVTRPRLADFDRDGTLDVLLSSGFGFEEEDQNRIRFYENLGGGTFADLQAIAVGTGDIRTVRPADLDQDGRYDVLASGDELGWYRNEGDAVFGTQNLIASPSAPFPRLSSTAGDINADGIPDLAVASPATGTLSRRSGTGGGEFGEQLLISSDTREPARPAVADLDGDGSADLLVQSSPFAGGELALYENEGTNAPASPAGLAASETDSGVDLSWSSVSGASGYNVYRALRPFRSPAAAVKINDSPVGNTTYTDSTGAGGQRFYYRTTTVAGGSESTPSGQADGVLTNVTASQVASVSGDGPVDFGATGVDVNFAGTQGSGSVEVTKFGNPPSGTSSIDGQNASAYRFDVTVEGNFEVGASTELRLDVSSLAGVDDPASVAIYKRSASGQGTFTKLPTTHDTGANELVAQVSGFSEFALGSDSDPLPVEMAGFSATTDAGKARLTWETASETGNARFEVQRKAGSQSEWSTIGSVDGAGTTTEAQSYQYTDGELPYEANRLTYRLRQVDVDGTASLTETVTVRQAVAGAELLGTYPNPADQQATVRYAVPETQEVTLRLYDVLGRQVRTLVQGPKAGRHKTTVDTGDLPSGTYFLRLETDGPVQTRKLTVVR